MRVVCTQRWREGVRGWMGKGVCACVKGKDDGRSRCAAPQSGKPPPASLTWGRTAAPPRKRPIKPSGAAIGGDRPPRDGARAGGCRITLVAPTGQTGRR